MEMRDIVIQGMRSILLHRLRTALSTLGILFGVVAVITMLSIGEGAKRETLAQIEQLGIRNIIIRQSGLSDEQQSKARRLGSQLLTRGDVDALQRAIPSIVDIAPLKVIKTSLNATLKEISPEILATTRSFFDINGLEIAEGRFLTALDSSLKMHVCVLGSEIAKFQGKAGHIGHTIRIGNVEYKVVGILGHKVWKPGKSTALNARNLNYAVFIPLGGESGLPRGSYSWEGELNEITLQLSNSAEVNVITPLVQHILERRHRSVDDYQLIIPQELMDQAQRMQYTFNLVLGGVAAISLLVGGIGIMNIMLASVSERFREIGIRRAVGANRWHIARQFLLESLLITLLGGLGGLLIGSVTAALIAIFAEWPTVVTTWSIGISLAMALGVGLCSGFYPAWKAASLDPITALRCE